MKLQHKCPTCQRPVTHIVSEFPLGGLINYVYQCGHLELRKPFSEFIKEDQKEKVIHMFESSLQAINKESSNKKPVAIKNSGTVIADIDSSVVLPINNSDWSFIVPEPTKKELYEDLDRWIEDGGAYKLGSHEVSPHIPLSMRSFEVVPEYFCEECQITHNYLHAYKFQREGIEFTEGTQANALVADAMGLGKTIQALLTLKRANVLFPCLIIVKGATIFQWTREFKRWIGHDFEGIIPVTERIHIIPGFKCYVISMDLLGRKGVLDLLSSLKLKAVIIDEVQSFKDTSSQRTKALIQLIQDNNIQYKIALSGTPIKNRADEYFPILNLLAPAYFTSLQEFRNRWLVQNEKGAYTKVNPIYQDDFKKLISKWVLRREKHEVLTNLPPLLRDYQLIEIDDPLIKKSYNSQIDLFRNFLKNEAKINSQQILGWLAQLRAITGRAKCKNAIEWTKDFLDSTDENIAIGIQHHSVRDTLHYIFEAAGFKPLKFSGEDNKYQKDRVVQKFMNGDSRILIINALAGGVGLNLQNCANALLLERQWSPADEEQFISRFHRDGQQKAVLITYLIAKGTIDEWFHDLIYLKSKNSSSAGIAIAPFSDNGNIGDLKSLLEFAEIVASKKL